MRLSKPSRWLLNHLVECHPRGIATTTELPCYDPSQQPRLIHMRGLVKRGWAREATQHDKPDGQPMGIFFVTEAGLAAAAKLRKAS